MLLKKVTCLRTYGQVLAELDFKSDSDFFFFSDSDFLTKGYALATSP